MDRADPRSAEVADIPHQASIEGERAKRDADTTATIPLKSIEHSGNYGTCKLGAIDNSQLIPETELCPVKVFAKSWTSVAPVLGPLVLIVVLNATRPGDLLLQCESQATVAVRSFCVITAPSVKIFPTMGVCLCLLLLVWKVAHERAYYVLLRHKIIVDLQVGQRFAFWTTATLSFLFVIACLHMKLKFLFGHPCLEDYSVKTDNDPCNHQYLLASSFSELLRNPAVINDPRNRFAKEFMYRAFLKFVTPGIVCLVCLCGMLSLESELLPLSKMLESHPCKAYRHLGNVVYIQEPVLRILISRGDEIRMNKETCTIEDVLMEVRQAAIAAGCLILNTDPETPSVDVLSQLQARPSKGQTSGMDGMVNNDKAATVEDSSSIVSDIIPSICYGISELLHVEWWPLKLLVRPNLIDSTSTLFRILAGVHFLMAFASCGVMMAFIIRRMILDSVLVVNDFDHYYTLPFIICALCLELGVVFSWMYQTWRIGYAACCSYLSNPSDMPVVDECVASS